MNTEDNSAKEYTPSVELVREHWALVRGQDIDPKMRALHDERAEWFDRMIEAVRVEERRKVAQEVHAWGAIHAGPQGAYAARVLERRIREGS